MSKLRAESNPPYLAYMKVLRSWSHDVLLSVWMLMLLHAGIPHGHCHEGPQHRVHQTHSHVHECWWCEVKWVLHELVHHHDHPPVWEHMDQYVVQGLDSCEWEPDQALGNGCPTAAEGFEPVRQRVACGCFAETLDSRASNRLSGRAPPVRHAV